MLSPEQSRAARGWLDWSQEKLAQRANVSLSTVRNFEKGRNVPIRNNLDAMREALESAGVRMVFGADGKPAGIAGGDAGPAPSPAAADQAKGNSP